MATTSLFGLDLRFDALTLVVFVSASVLIVMTLFIGRTTRRERLESGALSAAAVAVTLIMAAGMSADIHGRNSVNRAVDGLVNRVAFAANLDSVDVRRAHVDWAKPNDWDLDGTVHRCKVGGVAPEPVAALADGLKGLSLDEREELAAAIDKVDANELNLVCDLTPEFEPLITDVTP